MIEYLTMSVSIFIRATCGHNEFVQRLEGNHSQQVKLLLSWYINLKILTESFHFITLRYESTRALLYRSIRFETLKRDCCKGIWRLELEGSYIAGTIRPMLVVQ